MKIGLISDTHIPSMGKEPPPQVRTAFEGVDLILHAGDIYINSCIEWLETIAPVHASTSGFLNTGEAAPRVGVPIVVEAGGKVIGLVHKLVMMPLTEDVYPGAIAKYYPKDQSIAEELDQIFGRRVDIVVFGYTHETLIETHEGILFVNPGSPNMVKQIVKPGTIAVLELTPEGPQARIIELASLGLTG